MLAQECELCYLCIPQQREAGCYLKGFRVFRGDWKYERRVADRLRKGLFGKGYKEGLN
jgi:hypothetical protein